MKRYEYHVIKTVCEELGTVTYGISVRARGADGEVCSVKDISSDKNVVQALAERCRKGRLSSVHLLDVVEDHLV